MYNLISPKPLVRFSWNFHWSFLYFLWFLSFYIIIYRLKDITFLFRLMMDSRR